MAEKISEDIKRQIQKLVGDINYHNYRYYILDSPVISDEEYDRHYRRLKELGERYNYTSPDSPTLRVGAPPREKLQRFFWGPTFQYEIVKTIPLCAWFGGSPCTG